MPVRALLLLELGLLLAQDQGSPRGQALLLSEGHLGLRLAN